MSTLKKTIAYAGILALAALLLSCSAAGPSEQPRLPAASQTVACLGDSITYGFGLSHPETDAWPALLEAMLDDSRVLNLGVSGATLMDEGGLPYRSTGNIERAKEQHPSVLFLMLGTNDAYSGIWSEQVYRLQLEALVDELRASTPDAQIVLMAPPCAFAFDANRSVEPTAQERIGGSVRSAMREVAASKGAYFLDLFALTEGHPEWFPDGLHPNEEGHRAIADHIFQNVFA